MPLCQNTKKLKMSFEELLEFDKLKNPEKYEPPKVLEMFFAEKTIDLLLSIFTPYLTVTDHSNILIIFLTFWTS